MNIYNIEQELLSIFDEIEENGGELTPELESKLVITQDTFKEKVKDYTNVIKLLNDDILSIKEEQTRLKTLADKKQKTIERLNKILLAAINEFGNTKKSGVKYIDYGTGEISIRKSKAVDVDKTLLIAIGRAIQLNTNYIRNTNQLDVVDRLDADHVISLSETGFDDEENVGYNVSLNDLYHTNTEITINIPTSSLFDGTNYDIIKEIAKRDIDFKSVSSVNKTELKKELEENGACAPNIARLVENQNITIK